MFAGYLVNDEQQLPPRPPHGATNGESAYYRRRIDELTEDRLRRIEASLGTLDTRADTIDKRLNQVFGGLALIVVLANLFGPMVIDWLSGK